MTHRRDIKPITNFEGKSVMKLFEESNSEAIDSIKNYLIIALWKEKCYKSFESKVADNLYTDGIKKLIESQILPVGIIQDILNPIIQQLQSALENVVTNRTNNNMNKLQLESSNNEFIDIRQSITKDSGNKFIIESKYNDNFKCMELLGKGGFGKVYKAKKKADENTYAIKILRAVKESNSILIYREITQISKLNHPNIVRYYDAWCELDINYKPNYNDDEYIEKNDLHSKIQEESQSISLKEQSANGNIVTNEEHSNIQEDSESVFSREQYGFKESNINDKYIEFEPKFSLRSEDEESEQSKIVEKYKNFFQHNANFKYLVFYIQMELCDMDLDFYLKTEDYDITDRQIITKQIIKGLKYLHANNLIHRDLKPGNILLNKKVKTVKITDFGLSRFLQSQIDFSEKENMSALLIDDSKLSKDIGTPTYAAPETLSSDKYDEKVDIYSLGIIMYVMFKKMDTLTERHKMIELLKKHEMDIEFNEKFPIIAEKIYKMLDDFPENRPKAEDLKSEIFDMKCSQCNVFKKEIETLKHELKKEKEENITFNPNITNK